MGKCLKLLQISIFFTFFIVCFGLKSENTSQIYPEEQIRRLINQNLEYFKMHFIVDEIDDDIASRFYDPTDETKLCDTIEDLLTPTTHKRESDGKEFFIAQNFKDNVVQKVRRVLCKSTTCLNENLLPSVYTSICRQEYHERRLYVFEDGEIKTESFAIPSCCTCNLKRMS